MESLITRCAKVAAHIVALEVATKDPVEYWLGIPSLVRAEATTAVRELKPCGASATIASAPPL